MSNEIQTRNIDAIESALIGGDLSKLNQAERLSYYKQVCDSLGLNPLTKPFDYIMLNNKLTLYAKKDATEQLRKKHNISLKITSREKFGDVYVVTAQAKIDGREDESTGAVSIAGLKGNDLANAYMKSETKAKRRVTLSICGLGILDESEVDDISGASSEKASRIQSVVMNEVEVKIENKAIPVVKELKPVEPEVVDATNSSNSLDSFIVNVGGKYRGKTFGELGTETVSDYASAVMAWFEKEKKPIRGSWKEFLEKADEYAAQTQLGVK